MCSFAGATIATILFKEYITEFHRTNALNGDLEWISSIVQFGPCGPRGVSCEASLVPAHPCSWIDTSHLRAGHVVSLVHKVIRIRVPTQHGPNCPFFTSSVSESHRNLVSGMCRPCRVPCLGIPTPKTSIERRGILFNRTFREEKSKEWKFPVTNFPKICVFLARLSFFSRNSGRRGSICHCMEMSGKRKLDFLLNFAM